jgi:hypothetical protein
MTIEAPCLAIIQCQKDWELLLESRDSTSLLSWVWQPEATLLLVCADHRGANHGSHHDRRCQGAIRARARAAKL